ncbi:hypothetical protein N7486_006862 [Penicillium sp. IBT 16267x]|nr:hypothetical protein N7486_006862 [Penicillium sp. IBT 16267x]
MQSATSEALSNRANTNLAEVPDDGQYHPEGYANAIQSQYKLHNTGAYLGIPTTTTTTLPTVSELVPEPTLTPKTSLLTSLPQLSTSLPQLSTSLPQLSTYETLQVEPQSLTESFTLTSSAFQTVATPASTTHALPNSVESQQKTSSVTSASRSDDLQQHRSSKPTSSEILPILSLALIVLLMAFMILACLYKKHHKKQPMLISDHREKTPPLKFPKFQTEKLKVFALDVERKSLASFDTIGNALKWLRAKALGPRSDDNPGAIVIFSEPKPSLWERTNPAERLKTLVPRATCKSVFETVARILKWHRNGDSHSLSPDSLYSETWSPATHSSGRDSSFEQPDQSPSVYNAPSCQGILPPPAVALPARKVSKPTTLGKVSSGRGENVIVSPITDMESCTVSRASSLSKSSDHSSATSVVVQPVRPQSPSVSLFSRNVHRAEVDFQPSNSTQLRIHVGDRVVITRIFDDGWSFCENAANKESGLVPRAFLSAWPVRRVVTPPGAEIKASFAQSGPPQRIPSSIRLPRFYGPNSSMESFA